MSKFKLLLLLPLFALSACSDDDENAASSDSTAYATQQVTVVFMPNALSDDGFNSFVLRGVAAFCEGGNLKSKANDSISVVGPHTNTAYSLYRPKSMNELYAYVSSGWKKDNTNPITNKAYKRRLLVLTDPLQLKQLPSLADGEEILLLDAKSSTASNVKFLQIDCTDEFKELANAAWNDVKSSWMYNYGGTTQAKYYCPFDTAYLADGALSVLKDIVGDVLNVQAFPNQSLYSQLSASTDLSSLFSSMHIFAEEDFNSADNLDLLFIVRNQRQFTYTYTVPFYSKISLAHLISFDVDAGLVEDIIYRRYDKALVAWLEQWNTSTTMPQTTRFSGKDGMVETVLNNYYD